MDLNDQIKFAIIGHRRLRGPHCGLSVITLREELDVPFEELRPALRKLYEEHFFTVREGLNDKLIF